MGETNDYLGFHPCLQTIYGSASSTTGYAGRAKFTTDADTMQHLITLAKHR